MTASYKEQWAKNDILQLGRTKIAANKQRLDTSLVVIDMFRNLFKSKWIGGYPIGPVSFCFMPPMIFPSAGQSMFEVLPGNWDVSEKYFECPQAAVVLLMVQKSGRLTS